MHMSDAFFLPGRPARRHFLTKDSLMTFPLSGRTALITGVSRRQGIGFSVATTLARLGANIFFHHYTPHDTDQPWGGDDLDAVRTEIAETLTPGATSADQHADLRHSDSIEPLLDAASELTGRIDLLICNQAMSGHDGSIFDMTAAHLDDHWQTNARASLLLTAGLARRIRSEQQIPDSPSARPGEAGQSARPFPQPTARVIWMTSGQADGPMRGEVAYATSKAALAGMTPTIAAELLDVGVVLNTINPGPVNTGYLNPDSTDRDLSWVPEFLASTPFGRLGHPDDPARLIGWLCTDEASWIVGQVLTTDGGFALR